MAVIQTSGLINGLKGVLSGSILQFNSGGNIIRSRVAIGNNKQARSLFGQLHQGIFTGVVQTWRTLTIAQQAAWLAIVASYPTVDKFGNPRNPTAFELYTRLNTVLADGGDATLTTPLPPVVIFDAGAFTVASTAADPNELNWTNPLVAGGSVRLRVRATPPTSKGKNRLGLSFATLTTIVGVGTGPIALSALYESHYGTPPTNSRVWYRMDAIMQTTGQEGNTHFAFQDI